MVRHNSKSNSVVRTEGRTDVQAVAWLVRNPVLVDADELLQELNNSVAIERLEGSRSACIHAKGQGDIRA